MSDLAIPEGAACEPNILGPGRRMRMRLAQRSAIVGAVAALVFIALGLPWFVKILVAVPAGVAVASWLQVRRNTCLVLSAYGLAETEEGRNRRVSAERAKASKRVSLGIVRDAVLAGLVAGGLMALTAFA